MKKGTVLLTILVILGVLVVAVAAYTVGKREAVAPVVPDEVLNVDRSAGEPEETTLTASVKLPFFQDGGNMVCGVKMVYLDRVITPTTAPLTAAYRALFATPEPYIEKGAQYQNPIGYQTTKTEFPKLSFDRVTMSDGVASVYLRGSITGVGTCYDPLPKLQLDAVAKQFETVKSVKYYLNGKPFDPGSIADQRG
jgi:hypothetical protein